jgi:hypothetical protein
MKIDVSNRAEAIAALTGPCEYTLEMAEEIMGVSREVRLANPTVEYSGMAGTLMKGYTVVVPMEDEFIFIQPVKK